MELIPDDNNLEVKIKQEPEPKVYPKVDVTVSLICIMLGYLFIKLVLPNLIGTYSMIFNVIFCVVAIIYFKKKSISISKTSIVLLGVILLFDSNFIISSNSTIKFFNIIFVIALIIYWVFITASKTEAFKNSFIFDWFNSAFNKPFNSYADCPKSITSSFGKTHFSKNLLFVIIGLVFTIPITIVVATLLLSADTAFEHLFRFLFSNIFNNIFTFLVQFAFGLLVAFYLFGLLYSNVNKENTLNKNKETTFLQKTKIVEPVILFSALTPICLLYVMFFLSQATYFLSAFKNILPNQFSYAGYARQGFFELCTVCIINLGLIILLHVLCKENTKSKGLKFFTVTISIFTLMLISTALSKMVMYISNYGLTLLRVYSSWFMVLLAIAFVIIILVQFIKKIKLVKAFAVGFIIMFGILNFSNIDGIIANYNITQYQNGNLKELDIGMMDELSVSAVKYVAPLIDSDDAKISGDAKVYLANKRDEINNDFSHFNFSTREANKVLEKYKDKIDKLNHLKN